MKKDSIQTKKKAARSLGVDAMQQVRGGATVDVVPQKKNIVGNG